MLVPLLSNCLDMTYSDWVSHKNLYKRTILIANTFDLVCTIPLIVLELLTSNF